MEECEFGAARMTGSMSVGCAQRCMSSRSGDGRLSWLREAVRLRERLAGLEGTGCSVGVNGVRRGEPGVGRGSWRGECVGVWAQRSGNLRRMGVRLRDSEWVGWVLLKLMMIGQRSRRHAWARMWRLAIHQACRRALWQEP